MEPGDAAGLSMDQRSLLLKCPWGGSNPEWGYYHVGMSEYAEFSPATLVALNKAMARRKFRASITRAAHHGGRMADNDETDGT